MTTPSKVYRRIADKISRQGRERLRRHSAFFEFLREKAAHSGDVQVFLSYPSDNWHVPVASTKESKNVSEPTQAVSHIQSRLEELEKKVQTTIDIGLENRKLLEQLLEEESRIGLGAIHSLDQGRAQLSHPLIYNYQVLGDEVVAGIEEFGVYEVGATEFEAVGELQKQIWSLVQDLEQTPPEELGTHLRKTLMTLRGRMQQSGLDA